MRDSHHFNSILSRPENLADFISFWLFGVWTQFEAKRPVDSAAVFFNLFSIIPVGFIFCHHDSYPSTKTMLLPDNYGSFFKKKVGCPISRSPVARVQLFRQGLPLFHIIHICNRADNSVVGPLAGFAFTQLVVPVGLPTHCDTVGSPKFYHT